MTKEITKSIILQEIQDKLKLREFAPANFLFDETVVPVYNIERHLEEWTTKEKTVSITAANSFIFYTVPQNERWHLRAYWVLFLMTGAIKATGILVQRKKYPITFYLDLTKGQEVTYLVNLPNPVVLEPGDQLQAYIDTYVSTQDLRLYIDYMREEIR